MSHQVDMQQIEKPACKSVILGVEYGNLTYRLSSNLRYSILLKKMRVLHPSVGTGHFPESSLKTTKLLILIQKL